MLPGFRFHPTEQELVGFYLKRRVEGKKIPSDVIPQVELYRFEPWELRDVAGTCEKEWFFFVPRDIKFPNGGRPNRRTKSGYWKATGTDRRVQTERSNCFGLKKTLVYYKGRAPHGIRTDWVMNEYRLGYRDCNSEATKENLQDSVTLCRIYRKGAPLRLDIAMPEMDQSREELAVQEDPEVSTKICAKAEQFSPPPTPESQPPKGLDETSEGDLSTSKLQPQLLRLSSLRSCTLNSQNLNEEIKLQFPTPELISVNRDLQSVRYSSDEATPTSSSCITSCFSAWSMVDEEDEQLHHCDSARSWHDPKDNSLDTRYLQEIELWSFCTDLYDRDQLHFLDMRG